jgi:hypothetical protein
MRNVLRLAVIVCATVTWLDTARAADDGAQDLLDKAIKAHGGADRLAKVKFLVRKTKGKVKGKDEKSTDFTEEETWEFPDKVREEIQSEDDGRKVSVISVYNGDKGWIWNSVNMQTREAFENELAETKADMHNQVAMLYALKGKEYKLSSLGEAKVGDKAAVAVKVSREGRRAVKLFFDKKSNLLIKVESQVKDPGAVKEVTKEVLLDGYKEINGVQEPHKIIVIRGGKKDVEGEVTEIKTPEKIDAKTFEKP